ANDPTACAKPIMSVGSKKYIGLIKDSSWQSGMYNNFGGFGNKFDDYIYGSIESDLDILLNQSENLRLIGKFSYDIATAYYKSDEINADLLKLYRSIYMESKVEKLINNTPHDIFNAKE